MEAGNTAICPTQGCDAEYKLVVGDDGKPMMQPLLTAFECTSCKASIDIAQRKVAIGFEFACTACGQRHRVIDRRQQWQFLKLD